MIYYGKKGNIILLYVIDKCLKWTLLFILLRNSFSCKILYQKLLVDGNKNIHLHILVSIINVAKFMIQRRYFVGCPPTNYRTIDYAEITYLSSWDHESA